jgi:hypothetical protein
MKWPHILSFSLLFLMNVWMWSDIHTVYQQNLTSSTGIFMVLRNQEEWARQHPKNGHVIGNQMSDYFAGKLLNNHGD